VNRWSILKNQNHIREDFAGEANLKHASKGKEQLLGLLEMLSNKITPNHSGKSSLE
jgi:hypothetical protein